MAPPASQPLHPPPGRLADLIGHEGPRRVIEAALRSGRVHHAWVFHGPEGVGKFTAALAFAALLLDPTTAENMGGEFDRDPESRVAQLLAAGTHPDLHVVVKELALFHDDSQVRSRLLRSIPIDVLRQFLLEPGYLGSTLRVGGRAAKVFVVDEAELLNNQGQNALLKFLEEPPEGTVTILVTSAEERLLPTIRSRCQRVYFGHLSPADMKSWISRSAVAGAAEHKEWLLAFADGSPGMFQGAAQVGLPAWAQRLEPLLAAAQQGRYSVELGPAMQELVDGWAKAFVEAHDNASKEAANRAGADWMYRLLASHFRRHLRGNGNHAATLVRIDALRDAERELDANVNPLFVFEKLSAELAAAGT